MDITETFCRYKFKVARALSCTESLTQVHTRKKCQSPQITRYSGYLRLFICIIHQYRTFCFRQLGSIAFLDRNPIAWSYQVVIRETSRQYEPLKDSILFNITKHSILDVFSRRISQRLFWWTIILYFSQCVHSAYKTWRCYCSWSNNIKRVSNECR